MGSFILRTPFNRSVSLARRARRYQSILFARRKTGKAKTTRCLQRSERSLQTESRCSNLHTMATLGPKNGRTFGLCTTGGVASEAGVPTQLMEAGLAFCT